MRAGAAPPASSGAAETVGADSNGVGGTTNSASLDSSRAITAGTDFGRGAKSEGALAGAVPVAAFGLGRAFAFGALRDTAARACCAWVRCGDLNVTTAGPVATVRSVDTGGACGGSDAMPGFGSATGAGVSTTRRSGTSPRRSCQGKAKPGSPNSSPLKTRLNSIAWTSRESSSEYESRLPWGLARRSGCRRRSATSSADAGNGPDGCSGTASDFPEFKCTPPSRPGHCGGCGATWPPAQRGLPWLSGACQGLHRHSGP